MRKIRYTLPLLPLKRLSVFPGMILHFDVRRQQSVAAVKNAMNNDKLIFMCFQNNMEQSEPQAEDLAEIGTIAEVHQISQPSRRKYQSFGGRTLSRKDNKI